MKTPDRNRRPDLFPNSTFQEWPDISGALLLIFWTLLSTVTYTSCTSDEGSEITHELITGADPSASGSFGLPLDATLLTDIAITAVSIPDTITANETVQVYVAVQNVGTDDVREPIEVTLINQNDRVEIGSQQIQGGLARDNSITLTFFWSTVGLASGYRILSAYHNVNDDDESNNAISVSTYLK